MALTQMKDHDKQVILECLKFVYCGDDIKDREFQTRLGIFRTVVKEIIDSWPNIDDSDSNRPAVLSLNNCMNEVCYGITITPERWHQSFSVSKDEVKLVYDTWSRLRNSQGGWM